MELIVRTAHGSADVAAELRGAEATLADLVQGVTGQAAPRVALVDGRVVDTATPIDECALLVGSVIDTDPSATAAEPGDEIELLQLTGPGAGATCRLGEGLYRIGPGRRISARELERAAVEEAALQLHVTGSSDSTASTASASHAVAVAPGDAGLDVLLAGSPLEGETPWSAGAVVVDNRAFVLGTHARHDGHGEVPGVLTADGRIVFNRAPIEPPPRRLVVDAIALADRGGAALWHHRLHGSESFRVPVGLCADGAEVVDVDLVENPVVAVVGDPVDVDAHVRALLIESVTSIGPADLDVVVATTSDQLGHWDWCKWLPHCRRGDEVAIYADDEEVAAWADELRHVGPDRHRRTMLVVTDDSLWALPGSPLRQVVIDGVDRVSVVVETATRLTAPARTSAILEHIAVQGTDPALDPLAPVRPPTVGSRLSLVSDHRGPVDLLAPFVEIETAQFLAHRLARFLDPDGVDVSTLRAAPAGTITELLGLVDADGDSVDAIAHRVSERWARSDDDPQLALGRGVGRNAATVALAAGEFGDRGSIVVLGPTVHEAATAVEPLLFSMAAAFPPEQLAIAVVDHRPAQEDPLSVLPHYAGSFSDVGHHAGEQLVAHLEAALIGQRSSGRRVVVVIRDVGSTQEFVPHLVDDLVRIAASTTGVHVVAISDHGSGRVDRAPTTSIDVAHSGTGLRARVHHQRSDRVLVYEPLPPTTAARSALALQPFVLGRPMTALERRLDQPPTTSDHPVEDPDVADLVAAIRAAAQSRPDQPMLVPSTLPRSVSIETLFDEFRGDAIPIGVTRGEDENLLEAVWWQPGRGGTLLLFGSPRSGIRAVHDTLLLGAVRRFSPADLRVSVIEGSRARRRSIERLEHADAVVDAHDPKAVGTVIAGIHRELTDRDGRGGADYDDPAVLLIITDLGELLVGLDDLDDTRAQLIEVVRDGATLGINVVASAMRVTEVGDVRRTFETVIVGGLSDGADYERLGIDDPLVVERDRGRCVEMPGHRQLQLAMSTVSLDEAIDAEFSGAGAEEAVHDGAAR